MAAVIGSPIGHSLSPLIQNKAFKALDYDAVYLAFDLSKDQADYAVEAMRNLGFLGLNVTMPLKSEVIKYLDGLTESAQALDSCNTIYWNSGKLIGTSTDGIGFLRAIKREFGNILRGSKIVILGAGGAARSIIHALGKTEVSEILIYNRTLEKAVEASKLAKNAKLIDYQEIASGDIIVNTTSLGMAGQNENMSPVGEELINSSQIIIDIVYNPLETKLMSFARDAGAKVMGGLPMLVEQAAESFEIWTNLPAPLDIMYGAACSNM